MRFGCMDSMASVTIHLFSAYPRVYRVDYVITLGITPFYTHDRFY